MPRSPRKWTEREDRLLSQEVQTQLADGKVKDWTAIASKISGRTNKDCRKRWHNALSGGYKKGYWTEEEDHLLAQAIQAHGETWTAVAEIVATRSPDQCAKRWKQCLDPQLDRSKWTKEENLRLVELAAIKGRRWKEIQMEHFPSRSRNAIKNQYTILMRRLGKTNRSGPENGPEDHPEITRLSESSSEENDIDDLDASGDECDMEVDEVNFTEEDMLNVSNEDQRGSKTKTDNRAEDETFSPFDPPVTFLDSASEFDRMIRELHSHSGMAEPPMLWEETGHHAQTDPTGPEPYGNHELSAIPPAFFPDLSCERGSNTSEAFYTGLLTPEFTDVPGLFGDSEIPYPHPPGPGSLNHFPNSSRKTKVVLSVDEADHNTVELLVQAAFRSGCKFHLARE